MRKARGGVKTNVKDSELLSLLPSEADRWWEVWLAPPEVRDRREWLRYRMSLVALQTQTKNRIHAIFHRQGIYHGFSDLFGSQGRRFLMTLCATGRHDGGVVPPGALAALGGQVRLLLGLRGERASPVMLWSRPLAAVRPLCKWAARTGRDRVAAGWRCWTGGKAQAGQMNRWDERQSQDRCTNEKGRNNLSQDSAASPAPIESGLARRPGTGPWPVGRRRRAPLMRGPQRKTAKKAPATGDCSLTGGSLS